MSNLAIDEVRTTSQSSRAVLHGVVACAIVVVAFLAVTGGSLLAPLIGLLPGQSEISQVAVVSVASGTSVEVRLTTTLPPVGESATARILVHHQSDPELVWQPADDSPQIESLPARCSDQGCIYTRVVRLTNCGSADVAVEVGLQIVAPDEPEYLDDIEITIAQHYIDTNCP